MVFIGLTLRDGSVLVDSVYRTLADAQACVSSKTIETVWIVRKLIK
jgi:hypothetical protein